MLLPYADRVRCSPVRAPRAIRPIVAIEPASTESRYLQTDGVDGPNGINVPKCGLSEPATREPPAMSISMIGLDTAKSVFQIHAVNEAGKVESKRKLRRSELIAFFEKQESCTVVMEACGAAHHWARMLTGLGHTVKLIAAEAVCEAAS